jgi:hypothetical protein
MYYCFVLFVYFFGCFFPSFPFSFEEFLVIGQDGMYKLNGEAGDQVSCLLPLSSGHSADLLQPLAPDSGADAAGEQLVATVPTALYWVFL